MARRGDEDEHNQVQQKPRGTRPSISRPPRPESPEGRSELALHPDFLTKSFPLKSTRHKRQLTPELEPTQQVAKRPCTDNRVHRKHERFWLPDGNAILEFDGIRFRVHQSWLAQHSERIADMLSERGIKLEVIKIEFQPTDYQFTLKAMDFEALLLFYEKPGDYRNTIEPPTLMSLIRAASWLGFDSDRVWLVKELEALWPYDLEELCADPEPRLDAPEVAALARMCEIDTLLKPAFYDMARTPGFGLENLEESEQINHADMLRLVRMREYLSEIWVQAAAREDTTLVCRHLRAAPSSNGDGNSSPSEHADEKPALGSTASASVASKCLSATARREAWVRLVYDSGIFTQYRYDPLCGLAVLINLEWTDEWCRDCKDKRRAGWCKMQKSIWEKIDEYLKED